MTFLSAFTRGRYGAVRSNAEIVIMRAEPFEGGTIESLAVVRVGNGDEQLGSLLEGFAREIHSTPLGDYPMGIGTRSNNPGSVGKGSHYLVLAFGGT